MDKWGEILSDVHEMQRLHGVTAPARVHHADGRDLSAAGISKDSVDLIVTSPPYPNNIDYSEVYKLELWLMGFIRSNEEFLKLRKTTMRSHPTSDLETALDPDFLALAERPPFDSILQPISHSYSQLWRAMAQETDVGIFHRSVDIFEAAISLLASRRSRVHG